MQRAPWLCALTLQQTHPMSVPDTETVYLIIRVRVSLAGREATVACVHLVTVVPSAIATIATMRIKAEL